MNPVGAAVAFEGVGTAAAEEAVAAGAALQRVVPVAAVEAVGSAIGNGREFAGVAGEGVVAAETVERVAPAVALEEIGLVVSEQPVVPVSGDQVFHVVVDDVPLAGLPAVGQVVEKEQEVGRPVRVVGGVAVGAAVQIVRAEAAVQV